MGFTKNGLLIGLIIIGIANIDSYSGKKYG